MSFQSYTFLFLLLPVAVAGWWLLNWRGHGKLAQGFLLLVSLAFYGKARLAFLPILLGSILFNFWLGKGLQTFSRCQKGFLALGLLGNLGLLGYFKYANFFLENVNRVLGTSLGALTLLLPLGISFFTFQQIAYLMDCYRGDKPNYTLLEYACFVSFFPCVTSGPIAFHDEVIPQLRAANGHGPTAQTIAEGLWLFSLGMWKKVLLAQAFGGGADWGYNNIPALNSTTALAVVLSYTLQLYFDFSGYSLMAIGLGLCTPLLNLIHTPENILEDSALYLRIYVLGLPFVFFYNVATGIFSALGDSKTPFWFLACSSLSNIFVDILFVTTFQMGVAGVAWATFLCQCVSCVLAVAVVFRRLAQVEGAEKAPVFSGRILQRILRIAIPSVLQQSFISVGNIILQGVINTFGSGVIAGYSAGVKLNNLVITSFTTLGNGISNYTAQNIGAGKLSRIKEGFRAGLKLVWALSLPMALLYVFGGRALIHIFIDAPTETAMQTAVLYLRILSPFYFVVSAKLVADGILRGAGVMGKFMVSTFTDLILRVVLAVVLSKTALGSAGIWCAWPVGWTVATFLSVLFYKQGYWNRMQETV